MVVVEEFAAKLKIELALECGNAFLDMFRLNTDVSVVVKTCHHLFFIFMLLPENYIDYPEQCRYLKNISLP
jgi:hypothetical protein